MRHFQAKKRKISKVHKDLKSNGLSSGWITPVWIRDRVTERTNLLQFKFNKVSSSTMFHLWLSGKKVSNLIFFVFPPLLSSNYILSKIETCRGTTWSVVCRTDNLEVVMITVCVTFQRRKAIGSDPDAGLRDVTVGKGQKQESAQLGLTNRWEVKTWQHEQHLEVRGKNKDKLQRGQHIDFRSQALQDTGEENQEGEEKLKQAGGKK